MVTLKGTIRIPFGEQARALPALGHHIRATRREVGCLHFEITQDRVDAELFHVDEAFLDYAGFARHQRLGRRRHWGRLSQGFHRDFQITTD